MNNFAYRSLGFKNYFENPDNQQKLINYIKKHKKIVKGIEKKYFNAWENNKNTSGMQFSVEKGFEDNFDAIVPHMTTNIIWNLRIIDEISENLYICEESSTNKGSVSITIINKDILPSSIRYDHVRLQITGFGVSNIRLFTKKGKNLTIISKNVIKSNSTELFKVNFSDTSPCKESKLNLVSGILWRFGKVDIKLFDGSTCYYATFHTMFGDFELYFPEDSIVDDEGLLEKILNDDQLDDYIYGECLCTINGDAYLTDKLSKYEPNYENNLSLCRRAFNEEEYDFLYDYLREDCTYRSSKWQLKGRDEIISKFKEISKVKCNLDMRKILLLSTKNESKNKYEGKEILLYTQEGVNSTYPFYVETDENGKIFNIEMDSTYLTRWGVKYTYGTFNINLKYIEEVEKLNHKNALKKITSLEFDENFDTYFDKLCKGMLNSLKNRKFINKKKRNGHYFSTAKISVDKKNKKYNIEYNRSNNFSINDVLYYNYLCLLFKPNYATQAIKNNDYSINRTGIRFNDDNCEIYFNLDGIKKVYKDIDMLNTLLSKKITKESLKNELLFKTIDTFAFPGDITYKYLTFKGKVDVFNYCRKEIRLFYKDFIKHMTILINVAEKNNCDYITMIMNR